VKTDVADAGVDDKWEKTEKGVEGRQDYDTVPRLLFKVCRRERNQGSQRKQESRRTHRRHGVIKKQT